MELIYLSTIREILLISLHEDCFIHCLNFTDTRDYSGQTNFIAASQFVDIFEEEINAMKENAIPKGTKDEAKSGVTLFEVFQVLLIVLENVENCDGNVVDVDRK